MRTPLIETPSSISVSTAAQQARDETRRASENDRKKRAARISALVAALALSTICCGSVSILLVIEAIKWIQSNIH